ncbi:unnamed protein product, partial [Ectocarpus sp. 13 AM-2016]
ASGGVCSRFVGGDQPAVAADVQRTRAASLDFRVEQDRGRGGSQATHEARPLFVLRRVRRHGPHREAVLVRRERHERQREGGAAEVRHQLRAAAAPGVRVDAAAVLRAPRGDTVGRREAADGEHVLQHAQAADLLEREGAQGKAVDVHFLRHRLRIV